MVSIKKQNFLWKKCTPIRGYDPAVWRYDVYGYVIKRSDYGDQSSKYGWHAGHILAKHLGGSNSVRNLQAMNWRVNVKLGAADLRPLSRHNTFLIV